MFDNITAMIQHRLILKTKVRVNENITFELKPTIIDTSEQLFPKRLSFSYTKSVYIQSKNYYTESNLVI